MHNAAYQSFLLEDSYHLAEQSDVNVLHIIVIIVIVVIIIILLLIIIVIIVI